MSDDVDDNINDDIRTDEEEEQKRTRKWRKKGRGKDEKEEWHENKPTLIEGTRVKDEYRNIERMNGKRGRGDGEGEKKEGKKNVIKTEAKSG